MTNGFLRVASVSPILRIADVEFNIDKILESVKELDRKEVDIAVFPELCVTGYTCADLFHSQILLEAAQKGLDRLTEASRSLAVDIIVGLPRCQGNSVYNSAALISAGTVQFIDKTYLPNYNEFYEKRWFAPGSCNNVPLMSHGVEIGIEICEDLWAPIPPSCALSMSGAKVIFNLSASDDLIGKHNYLVSLLQQQSGRCICGYVYSSAGFGESTTDLVFLPKNIICENGTLLCENNREDFMNGSCVIADIDVAALVRDRLHNTTFNDCALKSTLNPEVEALVPVIAETDSLHLPAYRQVARLPFIPPTDDKLDARCREIITIQECALASRLNAVGNPKVVVGISGGLDSTLALLVAHSTFAKTDRSPEDIIAVTMPGFGTTDRTYDNAMSLMRELGVTIKEIPIADAVTQHFRDIGHDGCIHDVTYENSQARERTQILMDLANQVNGIVLGTGDLSELALGWATYNGDHMSMYGINAGVPKTLVRFLVRHYARVTDNRTLAEALADIIDTPISPELIPADSDGKIAQKTESLVGPYELNDFFLYYMLRYGFSPARVYILARKAFPPEDYSDAELIKWMKVFYRRFFTQQFKRSCLPDGPKIGSVCLSPRGDWRMPSDASYSLWISEIERLEAAITRS